MRFNAILTLCLGNICRSPVAAAALGRALPAHVIASAGFAAPPDSPASPLMVQLAAEVGLDLSGHRAKRLSSIRPETYDVILVMEKSHLDEIARLHPFLRARTMLLTHWSGGGDIADPIRETAAFNRTVFNHILSGCGSWAAKIEKAK